MRTISVSCLTLAVSWLLAGELRADDSPRALIEKAIKAQGGEEQPGPSLAFQTRNKGTIFLPGGGAAGNDISFTGLIREQSGAHYYELTVDVGGQKMSFKRG